MNRREQRERRTQNNVSHGWTQSVDLIQNTHKIAKPIVNTRNIGSNTNFSLGLHYS